MTEHMSNNSLAQEKETVNILVDGLTLFDDGSHIIYVNGNYRGNDEIGQLMKDFHQTDPKNMHYEALAQGVKHFKETEEGFWMSGGHPFRTDRRETETVSKCVKLLKNMQKNML